MEQHPRSIRRAVVASALVLIALGVASPTASAFCLGKPPQWWTDEEGGPCEKVDIFDDRYICVTSFPLENCL
jgi:hypothetical protein